MLSVPLPALAPEHTASRLWPGAYDVTVKMASFKTFHVTDLQLTVGVLPLNVQLEPGARWEEVRCELTRFRMSIWKPRKVNNLVDEENQGPAVDHA
jgi:hypothetical protein